MEKLSKMEIKIVTLMHKGIDQEVVKVKLNLNDKNFHAYTRSIFQKLNVSNWINTFRVALHEIKHDNLKQNEMINNYILKSASNIKRLKKLKTLSRNERKMSLFNELISLYSVTQFKYPLKYFKDTTK